MKLHKPHLKSTIKHIKNNQISFTKFINTKHNIIMKIKSERAMNLQKKKRVPNDGVVEMELNVVEVVEENNVCVVQK